MKEFVNVRRRFSGRIRNAVFITYRFIRFQLYSNYIRTDFKCKLMRTTKSAQMLKNVIKLKVSLVVKRAFVNVKRILCIGTKNRQLAVCS
jgi:hypothetical protein